MSALLLQQLRQLEVLVDDIPDVSYLLRVPELKQVPAQPLEHAVVAVPVEVAHWHTVA